MDHGGADIETARSLRSRFAELTHKGNGVLGLHAFGVLRERLCGDAAAGSFKTRLVQGILCGCQELLRFLNSGCVVVLVDFDEGRDGANPGPHFRGARRTNTAGSTGESGERQSQKWFSHVL